MTEYGPNLETAAMYGHLKKNGPVRAMLIWEYDKGRRGALASLCILRCQAPLGERRRLLPLGNNMGYGHLNESDGPRVTCRGSGENGVMT